MMININDLNKKEEIPFILFYYILFIYFSSYKKKKEKLVILPNTNTLKQNKYRNKINQSTKYINR